MSEEIEILLDVVTRLEAAGIVYMVTGSMALAVYATPRMTRDIDIVIHLSVADVEKILTAFSVDYYVDPETVRDAIRRQTMFNLINLTTFMKIDFIVRKDEAYREEEFTNRQQVIIDGKTIWVVAPEDLILSKLVWAKDAASELQFRDVQQLINRSEKVDLTYLRQWATHLGVGDLLEKALNHA